MASQAVLRAGNAAAALPAELTSFVGRRLERTEIRRALSQSRLVTLTGFGGVGKTRLAQRVAADTRRAFPDGVWFVGLEELRAPELLADTVAMRLGLSGVRAGDSLQALVDLIGSAEAMLVLDNCEHVVEATATLADDLLRACPRLHVLATSREPLRIAGETIYTVGPLTVPGGDHWDGEPVRQYEAVGLFVDRAQSVLPDFALTDGNRGEVAQICRELEGIPLAIELAVVRLRALSPADLLARLSDRQRLLTISTRNAPGRQRTLDACVSWSYNLCSPMERDLWARAAVFRGGFEIDAAERLYDDIKPGQVLDVIQALTDRSVLVRDERDRHARYRMLEPIRDYGLARLTEAGRLGEMRRRLCDWFADLATQFEAEFLSTRQAELMNRLRREQANLDAAMDFCTATPGEAEKGLALLASLHDFVIAYGLLTQTRHWLDQLLAIPGEPTPTRVAAIRTAIWLAAYQDDLDVSERLVADGRELAAQLGGGAAADIDQAAGLHALATGELHSASSHLERALGGHRAAQRPLREVETTNLLTVTLYLAGDLDRALASHEACLAITEPLGESWLRSISLWSAGLVRFAMGDAKSATELESESLKLRHVVNDRLGIALCLDALALIGADSDPVRSSRLIGAADRVFQHMGMPPPLAAQRTASERRVRGLIGDDRFTTERNFGFALDPAAATEFALSGRAPAKTSRTADRGSADVLTRRELEIAHLVAHGMTNRDIAGKLVISVRTAEAHVEKILTKLGFTSRAQIAAWITERHPG